MLQFLATAKVYCGNVHDIPQKIPKLTSEIFLLLEIAIPILIVIMGTIDLFKSITADKEDEMAKGRKLFFKRLLTGAIVFFVFAIVKVIVSALNSDANSQNIIDCMDCFVNGDCTPEQCNLFEGRWSCELGGEKFRVGLDGSITYIGDDIYDENGNVIGAVPTDSRSLRNEFMPEAKCQCPSSSKYSLVKKSSSSGVYIEITRK